MSRIVIVTTFAVLTGIAGPSVTPAGAQPRPSAGPMTLAADRAYAEFTVGPTFGHKSNVSVGGEGGYWLGDFIGVFFEAGHMRDVAGSDIENHAQTIASYLSGAASTKQPATYFDGGVSVRMPTTGRWAPYVLVGFGAAHVSNDANFAVNGNDVTSHIGDFGVQLGGDLAGSYTKAFFTIGGGARVSVGPRWIVDVSYRYGRVADNSDLSLGALSTNRLQFGMGARF